MISIVVPVYNTEKYLGECIDSILSQTYKDLEIILVDDGSTDSSLAICRQYENKDMRVRVFHKENSGVSATRNVGINNAKGAYISFCDSDDVIKPELYEVLLEQLEKENVDRVCGGYEYLYDDGYTLYCKPRVVDGLYTKEFLLPMMIDDGTVSGFLFSGVNNSIFKKEILDNNNIRFREHIKYNEDSLFSFEYAMHSNGVYSMQSHPFYLYRQHSDSSTSRRPSGEKYEQVHECLQELCQDWKEINLPLQMERRIVTISLWDILDVSKANECKSSIQVIKKIISKIPQENYKTLNFSKMNRYKKVYCFLMKNNHPILLYFISNKLVPFLSKYLSR